MGGEASTWGPVVRQVLLVKYGTEVGATYPESTESWSRHVTMPHLPAVGDMVELWPDLGVTLGGHEWPVRLRRFAWNGAAEIELAIMSVDPPTRIHEAFQRDFVELPWYTGEEGVTDVAGALTRGNWTRS